jgi:Tol biopolymer transport system component
MSPSSLAVALALCLAAPSAGTGPTVVRQALPSPPTDVEAGSISGNGRFVAFVSIAKLLPEDGNTLHDIYVLDRQNDRITLETSGFDGQPSDGSSLRPRLSFDGRHLSFASSATNLVREADANDAQDVFLRDREARMTRRVSNGIDGGTANSSSDAPVVSGDGRIVVFQSTATNLVREPDANGNAHDIYVHRVADRTTTRVSLDDEGRQFASSYAPAVSADGQLVAFAAVPAGSSVHPRTPRAVHLRDVPAGRTRCISCVRVDGAEPKSAFGADVSADGRFVSFTIMNGSHARTDIAVHDRASSKTTLITRGSNAKSLRSRLSADGRYVVFESWASDLVCTLRCSAENLDNNLLPDVYRLDRQTGRFTRMSGADRIWWEPSVAPSTDATSGIVVFSSRQQHGPNDATVDFDLFVCSPACE